MNVISNPLLRNVSIRIADAGVIYECSHPSMGVAVLPRTVLLENGDLICSFVEVPKLGINAAKTFICRSTDGGKAWTTPELLWPELCEKHSICMSISRSASEQSLLMYGTRTPISTPGESAWCESTKGLRANELVWSTSTTNGQFWRELSTIPMTAAGAAEAPGAMCQTRNGVLLAPYSPYRTFDPGLRVQTNRVVVMRSSDFGRTWRSSDMLCFAERDSGAAEAWVAELSDGRLLGAAWHVDPSEKRSYPNAYALSFDAGVTWTPTQSTGIEANTVTLASMPERKMLFGYVKRKRADAGIGIAMIEPTETDFGIICNRTVLDQKTATQTGNDATANNWNEYSFGEPSISPLPNGTFLLAYWCVERSFKGIKYLRFQILSGDAQA